MEGRLQWQDGVGNIQICDDAPLQDTPQLARPVHQLSEVDAGWALAVAGPRCIFFFLAFLVNRESLHLAMMQRANTMKMPRPATARAQPASTSDSWWTGLASCGVSCSGASSQIWMLPTPSCHWRRPSF